MIPLDSRDVYVLRELSNGRRIKTLTNDLGLELVSVYAIVERIRLKMGATTVAHAVAKFVKGEYETNRQNLLGASTFEPFSNTPGANRGRNGNRRRWL